MFSKNVEAEYQSLRFESSSPTPTVISNNPSFNNSITDVLNGKRNLLENTAKRSRLVSRCNLTLCICIALAGLIGFGLGLLLSKEYQPGCTINNRVKENDGVAVRIPLPVAYREFTYSSPFSQPPPIGDDAGSISEPIWDSLIPNGLGYFKDDSLAPVTSIPTVFHQLHCLYVLRRAYYSETDELQSFDFEKNRSVHIAHCFDYLQQGLTCSADTTIEPAIDEANGFIGSGFLRECRDFKALQGFVEDRRVFDATGFLAHGLVDL